MIEALCFSAIAVFAIVYLYVRRQKKNPGWEQMGFPEFERRKGKR